MHEIRVRDADNRALHPAIYATQAGTMRMREYGLTVKLTDAARN
jgi:hypothetical protein